MSERRYCAPQVGMASASLPDLRRMLLAAMEGTENAAIQVYTSERAQILAGTLVRECDVYGWRKPDGTFRPVLPDGSIVRGYRSGTPQTPSQTPSDPILAHNVLERARAF